MAVDWKQRTIDQWSSYPCGWRGTTSAEPGTAEFFEQAVEYRYHVGHPWLPAIAPFARVAGQRVLEVGCGMGADGAMFRRSGARWVGLDLTPRHLALCAAHHEAADLGRPDLVRGDAERLPVASGSVDFVYSFGVLHHTPDTVGAIREIHRVLRPGGQTFVMLYHRDSIRVGWLVIKGLLRGELLRHGMAGVLSRHVERGGADTLPLVKVYSRGQARRMFAPFSSVRVRVRQGPWQTRFARMRVEGRGPAPVLRRLERLADRLAPLVGFYLIIEATK